MDSLSIVFNNLATHDKLNSLPYFLIVGSLGIFLLSVREGCGKKI